MSNGNKGRGLTIPMNTTASNEINLNTIDLNNFVKLTPFTAKRYNTPKHYANLYSSILAIKGSSEVNFDHRSPAIQFLDSLAPAYITKKIPDNT